MLKYPAYNLHVKQIIKEVYTDNIYVVEEVGSILNNNLYKIKLLANVKKIENAVIHSVLQRKQIEQMFEEIEVVNYRYGKGKIRMNEYIFNKYFNNDKSEAL